MVSRSNQSRCDGTARLWVRWPLRDHTSRRNLTDSPSLVTVSMHQRHGALTVYLVACVKKKQHGPAAAKHLYVSVWFKNACHYAEASHCPWFIVSAKHGLLAPDEVLMSYEKTL